MSVIENICRICMLGGHSNSNLMLMSIFKRDDLKPEFCISEALQSICGLEVCEEDSYPKLICNPCCTRLKDAYNLRQVSQRSHETFTNILIKSGAIIRDTSEFLKKSTSTAVVKHVAANSPLHIDSEPVHDIVTSDTIHVQSPDEFVVVNVEDGITIVENLPSDNFTVKSETLNIDDNLEYGDEPTIVQTKSELMSEDTVFIDSEGSNSYTYNTDTDITIKDELTLEESVVANVPPKINTIICCGCDKAFSSEMALRKHAIRKHRPVTMVEPIKRKFQCFICYEYYSSVNLTAHKIGKNNVQPMKKCKFCGCKFFNFQALEKHCINFHEDELYKCCCCSFPAHTLAALTQHSYAHRKENREFYANFEEGRYQCNLCLARFVSLNEKWRHERYPYRKFKGTKQIEQNIDPNIELAICCKCPRVYETSLDLRIHQTKMHTAQRDLSGKKPIECSECLLRFHTVEQLDEHRQKGRMNKSHYSCGRCNVAVRFLHELVNHMQLHKKSKIRTRYSFTHLRCPTCAKHFQTNEKLDAHCRKQHTVGKGFPCCDCSESFRSKQELVAHIIIHTRRFSYHCDICQNGFRQMSLLIKHYERHTTKSDKTFKCQHCGALYSKADFLAHHVKYRHRNLEPPS